MKVKDLIAELQRFDGDANVAVEVIVKETDTHDEYAEHFDTASVEPENSGRHSLKIVAR